MTVRAVPERVFRSSDRVIDQFGSCPPMVTFGPADLSPANRLPVLGASTAAVRRTFWCVFDALRSFPHSVSPPSAFLFLSGVDACSQPPVSGTLRPSGVSSGVAKRVGHVTLRVRSLKPVSLPDADRWRRCNEHTSPAGYESAGLAPFLGPTSTPGTTPTDRPRSGLGPQRWLEDRAGVQNAQRIKGLLDRPAQLHDVGSELRRQRRRLGPADSVLTGDGATESDGGGHD